jgi:hypothetical protein
MATVQSGGSPIEGETDERRPSQFDLHRERGVAMIHDNIDDPVLQRMLMLTQPHVEQTAPKLPE